MLSDNDIYRLLDVANAACHHGYISDARTIYAGILAIKPEHAPAHIGLAFSHAVTDEFEEAERILQEQVLNQSPNDAEALVMLGLVYMLAKRTEDARETLTPLTNGQGATAELAQNLLQELH